MRQFEDTVGSHFAEIREQIGEALDTLRTSTGAGLEALRMSQSIVHDDVARLQARTEELAGRFDRMMSFLRSASIAAVGTVAVSAASLIWAASWNASRIVHAVEDHGRRIEKLEARDVPLEMMRESIEQTRKAIDSNH